MSRFFIHSVWLPMLLTVSMGAITIDQPEDGELLIGAQQPSGEVDLESLQEGDQVTVTWANDGPGFANSGFVGCDEDWNGGEFGETTWYASNSFDISGPGTWTITAKHLRGGSLVAHVTHGGDAEGVE